MKKNLTFVSKRRTKMRKIAILFMAMAFLVACSADKESAAVRQAEQQQRQLDRKTEREHAKMVRQHYRKQKKETKKTMRSLKRRARKMNKPKRFHPYIW